MKQATLLLPATLALALTGCGNGDRYAGGSGLIETNETIVSAETTGRVTALRFDEGTSVAAGDTLAIIDPTRVELELASARAGRTALVAQAEAARIQVRQARTAEDFARSELDRVTKLLESSTATQRQFDQAKFEHDKSAIARENVQAQVRTLEAQIDKADADIARLERQLRDCYPLAPIGGVITEKFVEPGELLSPGKALARISRLDTVWVKVYLPAGSFANIKLGTHATVSTESGGAEYAARVVWTSSEAEFTPKNVQTEESRADLVYAVKVLVPNPDGSLKVGMPVFVTLEK